MDTVKFLEALYGYDAPGHIVLWTRQDKKSKWYDAKNLDVVAAAARSQAKTKDVYFGISPQDKLGALELAQKHEDEKGGKKKIGPEGTRGYAETAMACPGLWLDIDIRGEAHKNGRLPGSLEDALQLVKDFPLEPTILVHSGHGIQAWWLFSELWVFGSQEERQEAQDLVYRFQVTMKAKAEAREWEIDSTFDLARVLRLPGTFNRKLSPEPVRVLHDTPHRYNPYDFEEYLVDPTSLPRTEGEKITPVNVLAGVPQGGRDITLFKYACRLRNKGMAKEEAEILVLQAAANCTPPFPVAEAREKVASAWKYPEGSDVAQKAALLAEFPEQAFEPESIGALAVLKKQNPSEYAKIKASLKGHVNLNDLERAVNKQVADNQRLHIVEPGEQQPLLEEILPDWPLKEMRRPHNWSINENGIWRETKNGAVCACSVPIALKQRLKNLDSGEEKVELGYYRDRKWHSIIAARSTVFNRTAIVQLTNKGLPVSTETSRNLVTYLDELERENLNLLPLVRSTSHMGWAGKNFFPGAEGNIVMDAEDGGGASVISAYHQSGTAEEWLEIIEPLRKYPLPRFLLAAAFATPLMKLIGHRVFLIHLWGGTTGGKTASVKAALSVWGDPEETMATFNATKVGIERMAGLYTDLPLAIDEKQVVADKQNFVDSLVYMLGSGRGKARGAKGGGLQSWTTWRTIVFTSGEEPISSMGSTGGIKTRTLELYGVPIDNNEIATQMHNMKVYGTAGPIFIRRLMTEIETTPDLVTELFNATFKTVQSLHKDKIAAHAAAIALIIVADCLSSQWVFGAGEEEAFKQAMETGEYILTLLETARDINDSNRAYEHFFSWYNVNIAFFNRGTYNQRYGVTDGGYVYVFPTVFDQAMKEGGFNSMRILRDWGQGELIKTEVSGGKKRFQVRKYDGQRQVRYVAVKIPVD